jgi:hypothetical protein
VLSEPKIKVERTKTAVFVLSTRNDYLLFGYICYPRKLSRIPAATAEPITPATFGAIACIRR